MSSERLELPVVVADKGVSGLEGMMRLKAPLLSLLRTGAPSGGGVDLTVSSDLLSNSPVSTAHRTWESLFRVCSPEVSLLPLVWVGGTRCFFCRSAWCEGILVQSWAV